MKAKTFLLAMLAIAAVSFASCSKTGVQSYGWENNIYPSEDSRYHDTLTLPSVRFQVAADFENEKPGGKVAVTCKVEGRDYEGNPWDEVMVYFDGGLVSTNHIPFEKVTHNLGTYDWERDWTVRIVVYTSGRTDRYPIICQWDDATRRRILETGDDF